jgi:hypothetical protein
MGIIGAGAGGGTPAVALVDAGVAFAGAVATGIAGMLAVPPAAPTIGALAGDCIMGAGFSLTSADEHAAKDSKNSIPANKTTKWRSMAAASWVRSGSVNARAADCLHRA